MGEILFVYEKQWDKNTPSTTQGWSLGLSCGHEWKKKSKSTKQVISD